jgi:hypothetical protein
LLFLPILHTFIMNKLSFFSLSFFTVLQLLAQPYIDIASAKFQHSPDAGVFRRGYQPNRFTYANIGVNAPLVFKDSSVLLLGLVLEKWHLRSNALPGIKPGLTGLALPLAFVKPLAAKWAAALSIIPRFDT